MPEGIQKFLARFDPLGWWLLGFAAVGLTANFAPIHAATIALAGIMIGGLCARGLRIPVAPVEATWADEGVHFGDLSQRPQLCIAGYPARRRPFWGRHCGSMRKPIESDLEE